MLRKKTGVILLLLLLVTFIPILSIQRSNSYTSTTHSTTMVPNQQSIIPQAISNVSILGHTLELTIQPDFSVKALSSIIVKNLDVEPLTNFIFGINKSIISPFTYDPFGSLSFIPNFIGDDSVTMNITLRYPLPKNQMCIIYISYELEINYIFNEEYTILQFPYIHCSSLDDFNLEIYLPINYDISDDNNIIPVLPQDATRKIENGIVKIVWNQGSVVGNQEYFYQLFFEEVDSILVPTTVVEIPSFVYIIMALSFVLGITLASFVSLLIFKRKYQPKKTTLVSSLLSESEQAVIQAINDEDGMAIQKQICERTGFSKSKVSQILLKLEQKDVLKRERWGRTNRVTITNEDFKEIELDVPEPEEKDDDW